MLISFKEQVNHLVFTPLQTKLKELDIQVPSTTSKCKLIGKIIFGAGLGSLAGVGIGYFVCIKAIGMGFSATIILGGMGGVIGALFGAIFFFKRCVNPAKIDIIAPEIENPTSFLEGNEEDNADDAIEKVESKQGIIFNEIDVEESDLLSDYNKDFLESQVQSVDSQNFESDQTTIPIESNEFNSSLNFDDFFNIPSCEEIVSKNIPQSLPDFHFTIDSSIINTSFELIQDVEVSKPLKEYLSCPNIKTPKPGFEEKGPQQWSLDVERINYYLNEKPLSKNAQEVNKLIVKKFGYQGFLNIASIAHQGFTPELLAYIQNNPQNGKESVFAKGLKAECFIKECPFSINIIINFELFDNEINHCGYRSSSRYITMTDEDLKTNWVGQSIEESLVASSLRYFDTYSDTFSTQKEAEEDIHRKILKTPKLFS